MPNLGALIADFLKSADADGDYSREQLRDLRGSLAHVVTSTLALRDAAAVSGDDLHALMDELRAEGVGAQRAAGVVHSLRLVYAYAIARGLVRSSPLVGVADVDGSPSPSPTTAMLALGAGLVDWLVRLIVVAFVLTAIGLAVALV